VKKASAIYKDRRLKLSAQAFCFDKDDNKNLHEIVPHYSSCIDNTIIGITQNNHDTVVKSKRNFLQEHNCKATNIVKAVLSVGF
jgi:hypothetical protein